MSQWQSCKNHIFSVWSFRKRFLLWERERFCSLISLPRFRLPLFLLGESKKENPASADWAIKNRRTRSLSFADWLKESSHSFVLSFFLQGCCKTEACRLSRACSRRCCSSGRRTVRLICSLSSSTATRMLWRAAAWRTARRTNSRRRWKNL